MWKINLPGCACLNDPAALLSVSGTSGSSSFALETETEMFRAKMDSGTI